MFFCVDFFSKRNKTSAAKKINTALTISALLTTIRYDNEAGYATRVVDLAKMVQAAMVKA